MTEIELLNQKTYLKAPSIELIDEFLTELDITDAGFERFYKIPEFTIAGIRNGNRQLPKKFWHLVYKKIKPTYGSGYSLETANKQYTDSLTNNLTAQSTDTPTIAEETTEIYGKTEQKPTHKRLNRLK